MNSVENTQMTQIDITQTDMPLTEAIVAAAKSKSIRTPKVSTMPSIVEEIIADLRSGKYTQESLVSLARIFGREFVPEPPIGEETPKEKKPRKSKKATDEETPIGEETPKVKKPRKSKKETAEERSSTPKLDSPKEKKPRKPTKTIVEQTPMVSTETPPVTFSMTINEILALDEVARELPNLSSRLEGFLEEEELSDIESDDE